MHLVLIDPETQDQSEIIRLGALLPFDIYCHVSGGRKLPSLIAKEQEYSRRGIRGCISELKELKSLPYLRRKTHVSYAFSFSMPLFVPEF